MCYGVVFTYDSYWQILLLTTVWSVFFLFRQRRVETCYCMRRGGYCRSSVKLGLKPGVWVYRTSVSAVGHDQPQRPGS